MIEHRMRFEGHVTHPEKGVGEHWHCPYCGFDVIKWSRDDELQTQCPPPDDPEITHVAVKEETMDTHTMDLVAQRKDGSSEWHCPICGRHLIFDVAGRRTVLAIGDETANHSGSAGGLSLKTSYPAKTTEQTELPPEFKKWAKDHGIRDEY